MTISDIKMQKMQNTFECKVCDFNTFNKYNYNKHLQTLKHKNLSNSDKIVTNSENKMRKMQLDETNIIFNFECICGKKYKYRQGLSYHKKKCSYIVTEKIIENPDKNVEFKNIFLTLVNENRELRNMMIDQEKTMVEQQKQITELIPKIGNTTNNNTLNQKFNINVFLNEKCRDAIDITDFIKSIKISIEQLDTINTTGMADGLSSAIITNLKSLSVYERPIHCTDIKRETLYIKDDNQWECDRDKTRIKTAIKQMAGKPYVPLQEWIAQNPDFKDVDEKQDYLANVLSTIGKPSDNIDKKIIKNVCVSTFIK